MFDAGGVVGTWPAGIVLRTQGDYVQAILELVDLLGEDHVAAGTKMPLLVGGLLRPGMPEEALAKLIGANFLRVFTQALAP